MYGGSMREREELGPAARALGLDALHALCRDVYPEQGNPLTVTAIVKYWCV
jgi:hypothetical protein